MVKRIRLHLRPLLPVVLVVAALVSGCTSDLEWSRAGEPPGMVHEPAVPRVPGPGATISLRGFTDCESDLRRFEAARRELRERHEHSVLPRAAGPTADGRDESFHEIASAGSSAGAGAPAPSTDTSGDVVAGTNLIETGVDETDTIKTDGRRIVTLRDGVLRLTVLDDEPGMDGTLDLGDPGHGASMYLEGDTVTLIASDLRPAVYSADGGDTIGGDMPRDDFVIDSGIEAPWSPGLLITQVDVSDPAAPTVTDSIHVDGTLVSTRAVGGRIHVVLTDDSPSVLPRMSHEDGIPRNMGGCEDVRYETAVEDPTGGDHPVAPDTATEQVPAFPAGPPVVDGPMVSIISFTALDDGIESTVIAGTEGLVYGSTDSLYVASPLWNRGTAGTAVHRFALTTAGPVDYAGSAVVPGRLMNDFSLSEYGSTLRVVTVVEPDRPEVGAPMAEPSMLEGSTRITTLGTEDMGHLGHIDGLAPGEDLRAVRFIGPMGYVVTFEQVDPLFAIDLGDPTDPVVVGALEIPGFSEYLHPVGDGLLLGVGRDVDPTVGFDEGLKVSLFDVSDPRSPTEVDTWTRYSAGSPVAYDHHAFTWDPIREQATFPVDLPCGTTWTRPDPASGGTTTIGEIAPVGPVDSGVCAASLVISTRQGRLTEVGWIIHRVDGETMAAPDRAVVVGDHIWTVSDVGLGMSPVGDPSRVHLIRW